MGAVDEAGVCYDRALTVVDDDRDLLRRGLRLYQKAGRATQALDCIAKLLPGATVASERAELWTARGDLLVPTDENQAIESYDMALSYDPGAPGALGGLAALLEKRGEWAQLLDIFEARTETGTPEERASALRNLSRIFRGGRMPYRVSRAFRDGHHQTSWLRPPRRTAWPSGRLPCRARSRSSQHGRSSRDR